MHAAKLVGWTWALAQALFISALWAQDVPTTLKFDGATTANAAPGNGKPVRSIRLIVTERGQATLILNEAATTTGPATQSATTQTAPPRLGFLDGATVTKNGNQHTINYDFANGSSVLDFVGQEAKLQEGAAVFLQRAPQKAGEKSWAACFITRGFHLPIDAEFWPADYTDGFGLKFTWPLPPRPNGYAEQSLTVEVNGSSVKGIWRANAQEKGIFQLNVSQRGPTRHQFLVPNPLPPATEKARVFVRLASTQGPIALRKIQITGELASYFGLGMDGQEKIIVNQVFEGPAQRAGVQVGDAIVAIDGLSFKSHQAVVHYLGRYSPGEAAVFSIERDGKVAKVKLVSD